MDYNYDIGLIMVKSVVMILKNIVFKFLSLDWRKMIKKCLFTNLKKLL